MELDTIECKYDKGYREYKVGDQWVPSVTSILRMLEKDAIGLKIWKKKNSPERQAYILKYSAEVGELIHYYGMQEMKKTTERILKQDMPEFLMKTPMGQWKNYIPYVEIGQSLFAEFWNLYKTQIRILDIEKVVANLEFGYAGRFDFRFQLLENGKWINCLGDIKTSKGIYLYDQSNADKFQIQDTEGNQFCSYGDQMATYNYAIDNWAERYYVLRIHPYYKFRDPLNLYRKGKMEYEFTQVFGSIENFKLAHQNFIAKYGDYRE